MEARDKNCKDRWRSHKDGRIADLRKLWNAYTSNGSDEDSDNFCEYGLSFDYVAPDTFKGQRRGYWRYQLSWGGPSDEFRFYADRDAEPDRIEYAFMDWFDGHSRKLQGNDEKLLLDIFAWFSSVGSVNSEYEKAVGEARSFGN